MAINSTVTINSKTYRVLAEGYQRQIVYPKVVRRGVTGKTLVSVGAGSEPDRVYGCRLFVPYTPTGSQGGVSDIQTAGMSASVSYTDHVSDATKWGQGTFNITLEDVSDIRQLGPRPENGYYVDIKFRKVLS